MRTTRTATTAAAFAVAAALSLTACGSGGSGDGSAVDKPASVEKQKKGGVVLDQPFEKPDLTLTDTHGKSYDMIEKTKGHPTLLYFGYTNCPDICPADDEQYRRGQVEALQGGAEEAPGRLRHLRPQAGHPQGTGQVAARPGPLLHRTHGDFDTIQAGATDVGVSIEPSYKKKNGDVVSTHGAQLLAFSPKDDKAHVLYTEGNTTPEILKKELPRIIKGENP